MLVAAAEVAIPVSKGGGRRRVVPWWTDECSKRVRERDKGGGRRRVVPWWTDEYSKRVRERDKVFRALRRSMSDTKVLEYQCRRAEARRTVKRAKRDAWREFCSTIGRGGTLAGCGKCLGRCWVKEEIPVLVVGDAIAMTGKEKADALGVASTFTLVVHLCEESKMRRCEMLKQKGDVLLKKAVTGEVMDAEFTRFELTRALVGCRRSGTGRG
ncbi:hypothetical protein DPEC_G00158310 [Dallia pectoralis]|uniref:Uncharacterized protein n=1 Tax=Dallia pectoralis TaxID=75939 RepID=A0ACC2GLM2_DALPE|nr:hypothetical protein DPEC_G00158310 [Dallia pectoralis]